MHGSGSTTGMTLDTTELPRPTIPLGQAARMVMGMGTERAEVVFFVEVHSIQPGRQPGQMLAASQNPQLWIPILGFDVLTIDGRKKSTGCNLIDLFIERFC
jgi:hypothetical protein